MVSYEYVRFGKKGPKLKTYLVLYLWSLGVTYKLGFEKKKPLHCVNIGRYKLYCHILGICAFISLNLIAHYVAHTRSAPQYITVKPT